MNFSEYKNAEVVQKMEDEIKSVDPSLSISSIGSREGVIMDVGTSFPVKGNKSLLERLSGMGWRVRYKRKIGTQMFYLIHKQV